MSSTLTSLTPARSKRWLQCALYALLSVLLLPTTAIVSNIESIQQTLGITLEKAYAYSPIPLVWLVGRRSLCVIVLIVAHICEREPFVLRAYGRGRARRLHR